MHTEIIGKRKSIRKYKPENLDEATLAQVRQKLAEVTPIYPETPYRVKIVSQVKRAFGINAPHYLLFYGERQEKSNVNIGFIGQQLDLFFSENGIGACWVGMAKAEQAEEEGLPFTIAIAFGKPAEPLHRTPQDYKRKALAAISQGEDKRLEAARLAPSGINAQGWYFIAEDGKIHAYRKKPNPLLGLFAGALGEIDLGIALWHIASESNTFSFVKEENPPQQKGFIYVGTVV